MAAPCSHSKAASFREASTVPLAGSGRGCLLWSRAVDFPRRFRVPAYQSLVPPPAPVHEAEMSAVHRGDGSTPRREYLELWTFFLCSTRPAGKTVRKVY